MMKTPKTNRAKKNTRLIPALLLAAVFFSSCPSDPESSKQKTFASAEDAVVAMVEALKANEEDQLKAIFGPRAEEVMSSGDAVADQRGRNLFLAAYNERRVLMEDKGEKILHIGSEDWPFPIPLIRDNSGWYWYHRRRFASCSPLIQWCQNRKQVRCNNHYPHKDSRR